MDSSKLCTAMAWQIHNILHMGSVIDLLEMVKIDSIAIRKPLYSQYSEAESEVAVRTYIWASKARYRLKKKSHFMGEKLGFLEVGQIERNEAKSSQTSLTARYIALRHRTLCRCPNKATPVLLLWHEVSILQ